MREIEPILDPARAAVLLQHPVRHRILAEAREPVSASELAVRLGQPRQRLNYHVRQLALSGLLRAAGRRRKRNMEERQYVATARSYVLSPELLGAAGADPARAQDVFSAGYLLALTSLAQGELSRVTAAADAANVRVRTLSLNSVVRFASAAQRASFAHALTQAVAGVIAEHTNAARAADGSPGAGRAYRLVLGCYPIPEEREAT